MSAGGDRSLCAAGARRRPAGTRPPPPLQAVLCGSVRDEGVAAPQAILRELKESADGDRPPTLLPDGGRQPQQSRSPTPVGRSMPPVGWRERFHGCNNSSFTGGPFPLRRAARGDAAARRSIGSAERDRPPALFTHATQEAGAPHLRGDSTQRGLKGRNPIARGNAPGHAATPMRALKARRKNGGESAATSGRRRRLGIAIPGALPRADDPCAFSASSTGRCGTGRRGSCGFSFAG